MVETTTGAGTSARRVAVSVGVACLAVLAAVGIGRALDREARVQDREVREWCAGRTLAGCPAQPAAASPADQRPEVRQIAAQIVDACERADRVGAYFQACETIHGD